MYGKNIDEIPMSEIEKMSDELSAKLDKNNQEFLNSVYTNLEIVDIVRETYKIMQDLNGTEVSEMDSDSRAYIEEIYEDYKYDKVDSKAFTTVFSGIAITGASFVISLVSKRVQ
ncbi:MAG TPA: hypothetical protein VK072_01035 [Candidatus Avamphibacillus sp.]|nr:hypothetical protein [Candidatus Avamphibacillus sp.]